MIAVAIGKRPTTMPLAATPTFGRAMAESSPNPKPTQHAMTTSPDASSRRGAFALPTMRQVAPPRAATTDLPAPTSKGENPSSATCVAGKVPENARTPRADQPIPGETRHRGDRIASHVRWIALSLPLMNKDSSIAVVADVLRERVAALRPGDALPSSRVIVEQHHVSPVTVSRALAQLAAEGLVTIRPGAGSFVNPPSKVVTGEFRDTRWQAVPLADRTVDSSNLGFLLQPPSDGMLSLAGGYPHPSLMATRTLAAAAVRAARRPGVWERPNAVGMLALRSWFANSLGADFTAADVLITDGGQSALSTAFRSLLPPGAPILVESPTYLGALAAARSAGLRPVPVPVDAGGIQLNELATAFSETGSRALYCQPTFHNPTGAILAEDRRERLLEIAADAGAFIIEDDFARWLAHRPPAPLPLAALDHDGRVIYISSLTKATSANLRIGALIARGPVAERLRNLRLVDDFFASRLLQETAIELLESPAWPRHLQSLSSTLEVHCNAMVQLVTRHLPQANIALVPSGGMSVWLRLADGIDESEVAAASERAGVLVMKGRPFYAAEPPGSHLRLSYCGVANVRELEDAIVRLAGVMNSTG
jgi:DNA-binding transcriptional MocR family regulator